MKRNRPLKGFHADLNEAISEVRTYFDRIIEQDDSSEKFASRLNGEMPSKLEDLRHKLRASLEYHLSEYGEMHVDKLPAQQRIRYYEDKVEQHVVSELPFTSWVPWRPELTNRSRATSFVLAGVFSICSLLAVLRAASLTSVKIPLQVASPTIFTVVFAAIAILFGVAAAHPEKIPTLVERERSRVTAHLAIFLHNTEADFLAYAEKAENALNSYLENLDTGGPTTK